jgi:hypothetical protein
MALARQQLVDRHYANLKARRTVVRVLIRSARIACGIALTVAGLLAIGEAPAVADVPFAALTLGDLARSALWWLFGLWLLWTAVVVAFGSAPSLREADQAMRAQAESRVSDLYEKLDGRST